MGLFRNMQKVESPKNDLNDTSVDELLSLWLGMSDGSDSNEQLERLISCLLDLIFADKIQPKLHLQNYGFDNHHLENQEIKKDAYSHALLKLIEWLHKLKKNPDQEAIKEFFTRAKNVVIEAYRKYLKKFNERVAREIALDEISIEDISDPNYIHPLVSIEYSDLESSHEARSYIQKIWDHITLLPRDQRVALILGLKDERGASLLISLPILGIASIRQIAKVLDLSERRLAQLWEDLPLHDARIAMILGTERRRVIRLRTSARIRLRQEIVTPAEVEPAGARDADQNDHLALFDTMVIQPLQEIDSLKKMAEGSVILKSFPDDAVLFLEGLKEIFDRTHKVFLLAQDYFTFLTSAGQIKVLGELQQELEAFRKALTFRNLLINAIFRPLVSRWLKIVKLAIDGHGNNAQNDILNPFIAGNPIKPIEESVFKGRKDIIIAIEKNIINASQRPALLLYGRRRTGKSSTLLNLPRLLSSQLDPVYIDCQDAKWHESDQAFCYNLAREIFERLFQSDDVKGIRQPQEALFEKNAFTRLDEYLDQFEWLATERGKRILLAFDEYEGLEESIAGGDISKNVLGKLRNIIQHRARIVVLVSGSHRFEELTGVNWASYLINTRTLELSFLDEPSARELLTEPVPQLRYEDGVLEEILRLTHCQPYLLQAVASELVNHLNELQKTTAERADLDAAVNQVLTSAGAYFANTWREDNSATEQTVLRAYAEGAGERVAAAEFQSALQSLIRKEMMEHDGDAYRLAVPLFGLWILRNQAVEVLPKPVFQMD